MEEENEYSTKGIFIGNESVGKTSMILKYLKDEFTEGYIPTLGAEFSKIDLKLTQEEIDTINNNLSILDYIKMSKEFFGNLLKQNISCSLYLWDIAGQVTFEKLRKFYLLNALFCAIVFDLNNKDTYDIKYWYNELITYSPNAEFLIVGNKSDLVNLDNIKKSIQKTENKYNKKILFTSAKNKQGIIELFALMKLKILEKINKSL